MSAPPPRRSPRKRGGSFSVTSPKNGELAPFPALRPPPKNTKKSRVSTQASDATVSVAPSHSRLGVHPSVHPPNPNQQARPPAVPDQLGDVSMQEPTLPPPLQAPTPGSNGTQNEAHANVAQQRQAIGSHQPPYQAIAFYPPAAHYASHNSQGPYQTPVHPHVQSGDGYLSQTNQHRPAHPHAMWQGYPYGYPPYAVHHPGLRQPHVYATPPSQIPSQPGAPNAQFGVDPSRLAIPPSFPTTPSSQRIPPSTANNPGPVATLEISPAAPPSNVPLTPVQTQIAAPTPAPLQRQHPEETPAQPALEASLPQPHVLQTPGVSPPQPHILQAPDTLDPSLIDHDEDEEEEDNAQSDSGNEANPGRSKRNRPIGGGRFASSGKGKYHVTIEKWNAEARSKGYNPDKAASGVNPWAGFVEGAGMGAKEDKDMYRRNYLLPAFTDQAQNTKTYRRWIIDLMTKAEDISRRTGCLFYMIAQHPTAGKPYSWYASPKLRREAPKAMGEFHGMAAQTFITLLKAEKETKIGLVGELNNVKAAKKAAEDELAEARRELAALKASREEPQQLTFAQSTLTLERLKDL